MTIEERLARIEHVSAGSDEQRRKDRETDRALWRDTQRQLNELTVNVNRNTLAIADTNELLHKLAERLDQFAADTHAADEQLGQRIASLVSGIGEFIAHARDLRKA
jgi:ABC-type transporter Mla subunit MlaD